MEWKTCEFHPKAEGEDADLVWTTQCTIFKLGCYKEACPIVILTNKLETLSTNYTHDRNQIMQRLKELEKNNI